LTAQPSAAQSIVACAFDDCRAVPDFDFTVEAIAV
jgi:hypothetical protein